MAETYARRAKDLTVEQLEAEVHKALAEAIPTEAIKNMPIGRIEEAQVATLRQLDFIDLEPIKWKFHCKYVFPPGTIECALECDIVFGAPNTGATMKTEDIKQGLEQLDQLARGDYHQPLSDIVASGSPEEVFSRVGRLVGITMKQPFAEPHDLGHKAEFTGSYREWELVPNRFDDPAVRGTWQYQTLEALLRERPDGPQIESVSKLGQFLQYETGFFSYLARAAQRYICNDPALRKQIDESVKC